VNDLWIAATAVSNDLPVITQDVDYEPLQALGEVSVINV
jgi:predicted nucleic acid-binding protein